MKPYYDHSGIQIFHGDCREVLPQLDAESIHCVVTSPPYWGLRDYGSPSQIGQEHSPESYISTMRQVFGLVHKSLRCDGTVWLNLGDSYCTTAPGTRMAGNSATSTLVRNSRLDAQDTERAKNLRPVTPEGCKPKDLVGIPWLVAFALRSDGWWLRGDHVWAKPNCMPESVTDRPTRSHEYVFLLTKSLRYWYNAEAVRTAPKASTETRLHQDLDSQAGSLRAHAGTKTNGPMKPVVRKHDKQRGHSRRHAGFNDRWDEMTRNEQVADGGNLRSVWWISPAQFDDDHYAVMPERVAQICTLAGCPPGGVLLDPFLGAGTSVLVAKNNQCRAIGIEIHERYCEIAVERLRQEVFVF